MTEIVWGLFLSEQGACPSITCVFLPERTTLSRSWHHLSLKMLFLGGAPALAELEGGGLWGSPWHRAAGGSLAQPIPLSPQNRGISTWIATFQQQRWEKQHAAAPRGAPFPPALPPAPSRHPQHRRGDQDFAVPLMKVSKKMHDLTNGRKPQEPFES